MLETYRYQLSWFETFRALESDRDELTKFTPKKKAAGKKKAVVSFDWLKENQLSEKQSTTAILKIKPRTKE